VSRRDSLADRRRWPELPILTNVPFSTAREAVPAVLAHSLAFELPALCIMRPSHLQTRWGAELAALPSYVLAPRWRPRHNRTGSPRGSDCVCVWTGRELAGARPARWPLWVPMDPPSTGVLRVWPELDAIHAGAQPTAGRVRA
jgi:hypothetical protein